MVFMRICMAPPQGEHGKIDKNVWREEGQGELLEFLANAQGEDYDSAVFDTKLDFDPENEAAVGYVASIAAIKAIPFLERWRFQEFTDDPANFARQMPDDGSVARYDSEEGNDAVRRNREARLMREAEHEGPCIYVPDSSGYVQAVRGAIEKREIPYENMNEKERLRHNWAGVFRQIKEWLSSPTLWLFIVVYGVLFLMAANEMSWWLF